MTAIPVEKRKRAKVWSVAIVQRALVESLRKLNPLTLFRNPVIFIVEVGAVVTTALYFHALASEKPFELGRFELQIAVWLWFTVLFANFAEAIAEGRGKAQAATVRRTRTETMANRVGPDGKLQEVPGSDLRRGDVVVVGTGQVIPGDGDAPGSKHEKRWQDVYELLDAGIHVIGTVNVQHLEGVNDLVENLTGVRVRETVPDRVIDDADEVEVVDISPEALRSRMRHGNIYPPEQAARALDSFFRVENLAALRDLSLRRVTREVEQQLDAFMRGGRAGKGGGAGERTLVLIDDTRDAEVAIRRAWRLANALDGELLAAYAKPSLRRQGMTHVLTVAMDLSARLVELPGEDLFTELEDVIRRENVSHVTLVAAPKRLRLRESLAERLLARNPALDVHLVARNEPGGE